jgi:hypothetical protein
MIPFGAKMLHERCQSVHQEPSPKRINFDKHSSFAERTHRSAKALA